MYRLLLWASFGGAGWAHWRVAPALREPSFCGKREMGVSAEAVFFGAGAVFRWVQFVFLEDVHNKILRWGKPWTS